MEKGALAQMNAGSLTGQYGKKVQNAAKSIVKQGLVQILGSDGHSISSRPPVMDQARDVLLRLVGQDLSERITTLHAQQVLSNQDIVLDLSRTRNAKSPFERCRNWISRVFLRV